MAPHTTMHPRANGNQAPLGSLPDPTAHMRETTIDAPHPLTAPRSFENLASQGVDMIVGSHTVQPTSLGVRGG